MILPLVHRDNPGVRNLHDWDAIGQRGTASGTTLFKDCFVPDDDVIGAPGEYYKLLLFGPFFQLGWAVLYVGQARGALEAAIEYVSTKSRPWAEAPIERAVDDPYIQGHVADMSIRIEAASQPFKETSISSHNVRHVAPAQFDDDAMGSKIIGTVPALNLNA